MNRLTSSHVKDYLSHLLASTCICSGISSGIGVGIVRGARYMHMRGELVEMVVRKHSGDYSCDLTTGGAGLIGVHGKPSFEW